jgi:hypothetical protein
MQHEEKISIKNFIELNLSIWRLAVPLTAVGRTRKGAAWNGGGKQRLGVQNSTQQMWVPVTHRCAIQCVILELRGRVRGMNVVQDWVLCHSTILNWEQGGGRAKETKRDSRKEAESGGWSKGSPTHRLEVACLEPNLSGFVLIILQILVSTGLLG